LPGSQNDHIDAFERQLTKMEAVQIKDREVEFLKDEKEVQ